MHASDLRDEDWERGRHYFEYENGYCNRAIQPRRSLINGILHAVKTGCQWRMLPKDFPPWKTARVINDFQPRLQPTCFI